MPQAGEDSAAHDGLPSCQEFVARHSEYVDDRMAPADAARWRRHVEACASCAHYDRVVRDAGDLVRDMEPVAVASDFDFRLRHRLLHAREEERARAVGSATTTTAAVLVAGMLAAIAWSPLLWRPETRATSPLKTPAVERPATVARAPSFSVDVRAERSFDVHHVSPLLVPPSADRSAEILFQTAAGAAPLFRDLGNALVAQPGLYSPLLVVPPGSWMSAAARRLDAATTR